jgi:hypothetical protein
MEVGEVGEVGDLKRRTEMMHRFLEHNLVVTALKAAYLNGHTYERTNEAILGKAMSFSCNATSVLPKEIQNWENVQKTLSQPNIVGEEPIVLSIQKTKIIDLIELVWLRGYYSSSLIIKEPFENWVKTLNRTVEELDLEAYGVVIEIIRKETSLLSCGEYKPSWALMVEIDCSIGTCNVDVLSVGDVVEYDKHSACRVLSVEKENHVANVCRIEDNYKYNDVSKRIFEPRCDIPVIFAAGSEHSDKVWAGSETLINGMLNKLAENKKVTKAESRPTIKNPKKVNRKNQTVIVNNRPVPKNSGTIPPVIKDYLTSLVENKKVTKAESKPKN